MSGREIFLRGLEYAAGVLLTLEEVKGFWTSRRARPQDFKSFTGLRDNSGVTMAQSHGALTVCQLLF